MDVYPNAIIGSGPGAMTCADYDNQAEVANVLFQGDRPGGSLLQSDSVRNWPGIVETPGKCLIHSMRQKILKGGTHLVCDSVVKVDFKTFRPFFALTTRASGDFLAATVVIATGASPRYLQVPGEKEYFGKGVYTCALCEGSVVKGTDVAIVGGGDNAVAKALYLAPLATRVYLLIRGDRFKCRDFRRLEKMQKERKVTILFNTAVQSCQGNGKKLSALHIVNSKTQDSQILSVSALFLAIGIVPNSEIFPVKKNKQGFIITDKKGATSVPGVFAVGDVTNDTAHQAITAAGDGCRCSIGSKEKLDFFPTSRIAQLPLTLTWLPKKQQLICKKKKVVPYGPSSSSMQSSTNGMTESPQSPIADECVREIDSCKDFRTDCLSQVEHGPVMIEVVSANCTICAHTQLLLEDLPAKFPNVKFFRVDMELVDTKEMTEISKDLNIPKHFDLPYMLFIAPKAKKVIRSHGLPRRQTLIDNLIEISK